MQRATAGSVSRRCGDSPANFLDRKNSRPRQQSQLSPLVIPPLVRFVLFPGRLSPRTPSSLGPRARRAWGCDRPLLRGILITGVSLLLINYRPVPPLNNFN